MATTQLLDEVTVDTVGDASEFTKPCTVYFAGSLKGTAVVEIQIKSTNADYSTVYRFTESIREPQVVDPSGAYSIRAVLKKAQAGTTASVDAVTA